MQKNNDIANISPEQKGYNEGVKIQYYLSAKDNIGTPTDLYHIIQTIAGVTGDSAMLQPKIEELRKRAAIIAEKKAILDDSKQSKQHKVTQMWLYGYCKEYDELKKELPAVTWSGTFTKRNAKSLQYYTHLMCLDIDKIPVNLLPSLKAEICKDPHTFVCFTSPSGNGLKVIFQTIAHRDNHKDFFAAIEKYFLQKWNVAIDPSGKDVCRLCFMSYDESLYINHDFELFAMTAVTVADPDGIDLPDNDLPDQPAKELTTKEKNTLSKLSTEERQTLQTSGQECNDIWESTSMVRDYVEGSPDNPRSGRNEFVFKFACNCCRVGIPLVECLSFAQSAARDLSDSEIRPTVNSAYKINEIDYGKYKKQSRQGTAKPAKPSTAGTGKSNKGTDGNNDAPGKGKDDFPVFWKEYTVEKGRGDKKHTYTAITLNRVLFSEFLFQQGFHLLSTGKDGYQICHSANGIIKPVESHHIKQFVINWCKEKNLPEVEEMLRKGQKQYFAINELDSLPYKTITFKKDTEKESYFYFRNCWVSVTADGITTHQYSELQDFIWEGNKIDHNFSIEDINLVDGVGNIDHQAMNCEFARFMKLISHNHKNPEESNIKVDTINERFFSFATSYGYMLDAYKHPANRKGIFAIDHKIGEKDEQHGRTGKSILPKAASYLKVTSTIGGKSFDPKYQFKFETITMDSQLVNFNDMPKNFDVESIFEVIADDYTVIRRNNGYVHFKYTDSPKVYASTNFTPLGSGASYRGRMHIIEASDYFSDTHSPYDEFGHALFTDWDDAEWNRFYNFSLMCVTFYKTDGLVEYPCGNLDARKLVNSVVSEFIDWMDDENNVPRNKKLEKITLLEKVNTDFYVSLYSNKLKPHTFNKWVKQYCKTRGLIFNPHKAGGFDKSNGKEFYIIGTQDYKPEAEQQNLL